MNQVIEVTTTCSCQESARKLAELAIEARLAACVQISGPIESIYRWQGQVQRDAEYRCTLKSAVRLKQQLMEFIGSHHSYETPQLLVSQVEASESYACWVEEVVR